MINNNENITNTATKYKAQKHQHRNTIINKEQNRTEKITKISSSVQHNENTIIRNEGLISFSYCFI